MGTKTRDVWAGFQMKGKGDSGLFQTNKTLKFVRTRTGSNVPHWKQLIQNGQNATSSLTGVYESLIASTQSNFACSFRINPFQPYVTRDASGHIVGYYTDKPVWTNFNSGADAQAVSRFLKKIREAEVLLSGPTFLGELLETIRMLTRPAAGLQDLITHYLNRAKSLKKGRTKKDIDAWNRAISNLWLEAQFGWKPLINDILDARKAYNSLFEKERMLHISAGGKDFFRLNNSTWTSMQAIGTNQFQNSYFGMTCFDFKDQVEIVRLRGLVKAQAATTARDRFARFGFTLSEFVPTAWELLPWSFLIDYFANIGNIIEAGVTDTSRVVWVSKANVKQIDLFRYGSVTQPSVGASNILYFNASLGHVHFRRREVSRQASVGVPILPELYLRLPKSDFQLLNIAALLEQIRQSLYPQNPSSRRNWHR